MPARRTPKIDDVKQRLLSRLRNSYLQPGDRFLSNRAVAELYGISYQTAHRLIGELCREGVLERRPQSGTYISGGRPAPLGASLIFHRRAQMAWSFGSKLLAHLVRRLDAERIDWQLSLVDDSPEAAVPEDRLPVIWELPRVVGQCAARGRWAVLINDRPRRGLESLFIDSVSTDDLSGGVCAAQLMHGRGDLSRGFAVLAGPEDDQRSRQRVEGFRSVLATAAVVPSGGWFFEHGYAAAPEAVRRGPAGLFCTNDQLASAVLAWCRQHGETPPPIIGFDDAPVAEQLNLTTIGIPWDELACGAAQAVKRRLSGDRGASSQQMFTPRPVLRGGWDLVDGGWTRA